MGNRIYGCDDCLAVCPWNKFAKLARETGFHARPEANLPRLAELAVLSDADFREVFRGSPIKRIGRVGFIRNVCIAIGNSGNSSLAPIVESLLTDEQALVRGAAVWALGELLAAEAFRKLAEKYLPAESDPDVRAEWQACLA